MVVLSRIIVDHGSAVEVTRGYESPVDSGRRGVACAREGTDSLSLFAVTPYYRHRSVLFGVDKSCVTFCAQVRRSSSIVGLEQGRKQGESKWIHGKHQ